MGRRLYVGNLPYTTGEAELQELFSKAGTVESVRVMRDAATGRARGFAFVEMATDEEAQKAATEFNQYQMGGRALTVNEARPKPEFSGGGGGFGGNRGVQPTYGPGTLVEVNEHHTVIDFDEHGRRVFATRLVVLQATNEPAPARAARKRATKAKPKASEA